MTYHTLTDREKERIFAEDVLGWERRPHIFGSSYYFKDNHMKRTDYFHPLTNLDHAFMGVEKFLYPICLMREDTRESICGEYAGKWHVIIGYEGAWVSHFTEKHDNPNKAIVEACIRIVRSDLFEGE